MIKLSSFALGLTTSLLLCGTVAVQSASGGTFTTSAPLGTGTGPMVFGGFQSSSSSATIVTTNALTGTISGFKIKPKADGSSLKVKATVSLTNNNPAAVKHVTADVYLSDDGLFSADDMHLITLSLSDFVAKGKIGKGKTVSFPLAKKVPSVLASYLEGKYIIIVPSGDGVTEATTIVIGPIKLP